MATDSGGTTRTDTKAVDFTLQLGRALHSYGTPAHRLEAALEATSRELGFRAQFFSVPTAIFASFGERGEDGNALLRVEPGEVNLEKMVRLDRVWNRVCHGELDLDEGSREVREIVEAAPRHGAFAVIVAFGLASACAARFFDGGWHEIVAGGVIGTLVGFAGVVIGRLRGGATRLFEPIGALIAALSTVAACNLVPPLSYYVVTLAALIVLVPGLTLTTALTELATRNLLAGTGRLMGALVVFFGIGFGVALGRQLERVWPFEDVVPVAPALWTEFVALALMPVGLTVLFQARARDFGWIALAGWVGYAGARIAGDAIGPEPGAFVGALLVGLVSSLHGKIFDRPRAVTMTPGIMLLVPGSIGFRSMFSMLEQDVTPGVDAAFRMALVGVALATGLLVANVLVPPRKIL